MKTPAGTRFITLPHINLLAAANLITLLGVAVPTLLTIGPLLERWLALILLAAFGGLAARLPQDEDETHRQSIYLILGLQSALLLALLLTFPQVETLTILFYILIFETMLYLPVVSSLFWLFGYSSAAVVYQFSQYDLTAGLNNLGIFAVGMLLCSLVAIALRRARLAQQRSAKLLRELQAANLQLQEYADQVETASIHAERNRLAREMHDTIGHRLTVVAVQLEAARKLALSDPERASSLLVTTLQQVREALAELRQTVGRLREPLEADLQLAHALPRLAESFRQSSELTIHLEMPAANLALPDTHRLALYRAAQEGLTNIQRHAAATQAWLRLQRLPASIQLEIEDNGQGLPAGFVLNGSALPVAGKNSFGLRGMRERLDQLGGQMELEARPEGGTRLRINLPLAQEKTNA